MWVWAAKCLLQFDAHTFAADLSPESIFDVRIAHSFQRFRIDGIVQPTGEADEPEHTERVVLERLVGLERCPDDALCHVLEALVGKVFDLLCVDVVEHGIDCGITSQSVFFRRAELHLRVPALVGVRLLSQVDEINVKPENPRSHSFEMLRFLWVGLDLVKASDSLRLVGRSSFGALLLRCGNALEPVLFWVAGDFEILLQLHAEL